MYNIFTSVRKVSMLNTIWGIVWVIFNKIHINSKVTGSCLYPSVIYYYWGGLMVSMGVVLPVTA